MTDLISKPDIAGAKDPTEAQKLVEEMHRGVYRDLQAIQYDGEHHHGRHEAGGDDEISVSNLTGILANQQVPSNHASRHQAGGNDVISVANLTGLLGTPQTPANHANTHLANQTDAIALDTLGAPTDNANLNADVNKHGLCPKLSGNELQFLNGNGAFAAVEFDPEAAWEFYDDFESGHEHSTIYHSRAVYIMANTGTANYVAGMHGVVRVYPDGGLAPGYFTPSGSGVGLPYYSNKSLQVKARLTGTGTMTGTTRFMGVGNTYLTSNIGNAVYWRFVGVNNYIAVCRAAATESTIDSGVNAAANTMVKLAFKCTGDPCNNVEFFFNSNSIGNLTTNIPTVAMRLSCGCSNVNYGAIDLDYWWTKALRS